MLIQCSVRNRKIVLTGVTYCEFASAESEIGRYTPEQVESAGFAIANFFHHVDQIRTGFEYDDSIDEASEMNWEPRSSPRSFLREAREIARELKEGVSKDSVMCSVIRLMWHSGASGTPKLREWLYPNKPANWKMTLNVIAEAERMWEAGHYDPEYIAAELTRGHS